VPCIGELYRMLGKVIVIIQYGTLIRHPTFCCYRYDKFILWLLALRNSWFMTSWTNHFVPKYIRDVLGRDQLVPSPVPFYRTIVFNTSTRVNLFHIRIFLHFQILFARCFTLSAPKSGEKCKANAQNMRKNAKNNAKMRKMGL
jgi:hypothetical protein